MLAQPRKRECCLCHLYVNHIWSFSTFSVFLHCCCRCLYSVGFVFMMTSSNGNIFRVTGHLCGEVTAPGEFLAQRPVIRSFDVFLDLRLDLRLSKQSRSYTISFDVSNIYVFWLALQPLVNLKPILFTIELPSPYIDGDVDLGMNAGVDVHIDI